MEHVQKEEEENIPGEYIHLWSSSIGLAKQFIWVFPYAVTEKCEQIFGQTNRKWCIWGKQKKLEKSWESR